MLLTRQERDKFEAYLDEDWRSSQVLLNQLLKVSPGDPMAKRLHLEILAAQLIAGKLRRTETFLLEPETRKP